MKTLIALMTVLFLTACATGPQLPYQYATLKLIESDTVTADVVMERVERVQALLTADHDISVLDLESQVKDIVGYSALPASDRLLVDALLGDMSYDLGVDIESPLSAEHREQLLRRLEWIAQAAAMAE